MFIEDTRGGLPQTGIVVVAAFFASEKKLSDKKIQDEY